MQTRCPGCQSQLRVPDEFLGKRVKCPKCGHIFQAGQSPPPVVEVVPVEEEQLGLPGAITKTKKKKVSEMGYWERRFHGAQPLALALIPLPCACLCGPFGPLFWFILGIVGWTSFDDAKARNNAMVATISGGIFLAWWVLGLILRLLLALQ
jgi:predicted Zn finger-like uncharacterized protein